MSLPTSRTQAVGTFQVVQGRTQTLRMDFVSLKHFSTVFTISTYLTAPLTTTHPLGGSCLEEWIWTIQEGNTPTVVNSVNRDLHSCTVEWKNCQRKKVHTEKRSHKLLVEGKKENVSRHITQHTRVLSHLRAAHFSCISGTDTKKHLCVVPAHPVSLPPDPERAHWCTRRWERGKQWF